MTVSKDEPSAVYVQTITPNTPPAQISAQFNMAQQQAKQALSGAVTGTVLGGGILSYDPRVFSDYPTPTAPENVLWDGRVTITRAENGLLLMVGTRRGEPYQNYIARDQEELNQILVSIIVAARLER